LEDHNGKNEIISVVKFRSRMPHKKGRYTSRASSMFTFADI